MRIVGRNHHVHHVETPEVLLPQEALRAYLNYGTPRWLSLEAHIKPGIFSADGEEHERTGGTHRGFRKELRMRRMRASGSDGSDKKMHSLGPSASVPDFIPGAATTLPDVSNTDMSQIPMLHFRECLKRASLNEQQIAALESNHELSLCTYNLTTLSEKVREIVISVAAHRKEVARVLHKASHSYVLLFERMVSELVRLARERGSALEENIKALEVEVRSLQMREADLLADIELGEVQLRQYDGLSALYKAQSAEVLALRERVDELERMEAIWQKSNIDNRDMARQADKRRQELSKKLEASERQLRRQQELENTRLQHRLEEILEEEARDVALAEAARKRREEEAARRAAMQRMFKSRGTQTALAASNDGAWDLQDGWPLKVSSTVWARVMWRRGSRFAKCPACRGVKPYLKAAQEEEKARKLASLPPELVPFYGVLKSRRRGAVQAADSWWIPEQIVEFVSHLPKSAEAVRVPALQWLYRELWGIFQDKMAADEQDWTTGDEFMALTDFVCQECLRRSGNRLEAEMMMFTLIKAIKEYRSRSPLVHLTARFMGLLNEQQMPLDSSSPSSYPNYNSSRSSRSPTSSSSSSLDTTFLVVYLYMRRLIMQRSHDFQPPMNHRRFVRGKAIGLKDAPPFVCMLNSSTDPSCSIEAWVPLDIVFDVVRAVLYFLPELQVSAVCRFIEDGAYILKPTGDWVSSFGNKVLVRRAMRRAMRRASGMKSLWEALTIEMQEAEEAAAPEESSTSIPSSNEEGSASSSDGVVLVHLDQILEYVMDVLLERAQQVAQQTRDIFLNADTNGDGLITYDEFVSIVAQVDPHLSRHTVNKMFREAYRTSESFAMTEEAFLTVCKRFGLVKLLDLTQVQAFLHAPAELASSPAVTPMANTPTSARQPPAAGRRHGSVDQFGETPMSSSPASRRRSSGAPRGGSTGNRSSPGPRRSSGGVDFSLPPGVVVLVPPSPAAPGVTTTLQVTSSGSSPGVAPSQQMARSQRSPSIARLGLGQGDLFPASLRKSLVVTNDFDHYDSPTFTSGAVLPPLSPLPIRSSSSSSNVDPQRRLTIHTNLPEFPVAMDEGSTAGRPITEELLGRTALTTALSQTPISSHIADEKGEASERALDDHPSVQDDAAAGTRQEVDDTPLTTGLQPPTP